MELINLIERLTKEELIDDDNEELELQLLPPVTEDEVHSLKNALPCPIPKELDELLETTKGMKNTPVGEMTFAPFKEAGLDSIFPSAHIIAEDACGNQWIVDFTSESRTIGPIYYLCHDPAVVVYQCSNLKEFLQSIIIYGTELSGPIADNVEAEVYEIWRDKPKSFTSKQCIDSDDLELRQFAKSLEGLWYIHDLRQAETGDGFAWGAFGPETKLKRHKELAIFAYEVAENNMGFFTRLLHILGG